MTRPTDAMTLQDWYFIAQILLTVIAIFAAAFAFHQTQTMRLSELLRMLESKEAREARAHIYRELVKNGPRADNWWDSDINLEAAASLVCGTYDIVGILAKGENRTLITKYWSHSITWTFDALDAYIKQRRKNDPLGYGEFGKLYKEATAAREAAIRADRSN